MKRFFCATLAVMLLVLFTACGSRTLPPVDDDISGSMTDNTLEPTPGSDGPNDTMPGGPIKITENYANVDTVSSPPPSGDDPFPTIDPLASPLPTEDPLTSTAPTEAPLTPPAGGQQTTPGVGQQTTPGVGQQTTPGIGAGTTQVSPTPAVNRATPAPGTTPRPTPSISIMEPVPTPSTGDFPLVPVIGAVGLLLLGLAGLWTRRRI